MKIYKNINLKNKDVSLKLIDKTYITKGYHKWINQKNNNQFLHYKIKYSKKDLELYISNSKPPFCYFFAIHDRQTSKYVGNIRLSSIDYDHKTATYGRMIGDKNASGKGYGSSALKLVSKFAFNYLKLNKIHTGVVEKNLASIKSNLNAGARIQGIILNNYFDGKKYLNTILFSIDKK
tara:strand:- start:378 stop:911 length:534 start_codon:yes stop_codon:yes gene_type:complete